MSSTYNHLRQRRDKGIDELKVFIRAEVELQERLEVKGYRPPTWRLSAYHDRMTVRLLLVSNIIIIMVAKMVVDTANAASLTHTPWGL